MTKPTDTPLPRDDDGRPFPTEATQDEPEGPSGDEREYTGEPVETDEGWTLPQQQNVGAGRTASTATEDTDTPSVAERRARELISRRGDQPAP
jgi:hypothetical protein